MIVHGMQKLGEEPKMSEGRNVDAESRSPGPGQAGCCLNSVKLTIGGQLFSHC